MGSQPLTVRTIFDRMRTVYGDAEVVDAFATGAGRTTYRAMAQRILRLVTVLQDLGVRPGDRVGTFAHNSSRHLELYYAVPLAGAVLHMVNIRLHDDQLEFVVADAGDILVFADEDLTGRLATLNLPSVRKVLALGADVDALLAEAAPCTDLPELTEDMLAGLCHTSGTTGMPKAAVYTHRSTYLHALTSCMVDGLALSERERVLP